MSSVVSGLGIDLHLSERSVHRTSGQDLSDISMNHSASARRYTTASGISTANYIPTLRSMMAIHGQAADGDDPMVQMDAFADGSAAGSHNSEHMTSDTVTPGAQAAALHNLPGNELALNRDDTLLSLDATPARNAAELKSLLGNNYSRLKPGAAVLPPPSPFPEKLTNENKAPTTVALEQAKPRARVEVDIILESDTCLQGNYLKGRVKVHVRQSSKTEPPVWLAKGRVRIIGYECIGDDDRHTFYQCTAPLSTSTETLYASQADEEGYAEAKEGVHVFPFAIWLPLDDSCGIARGVVQIQSGATVRYIAMASFKVKCPATNGRSIAHFYRNCEIWPRVDPSLALATAPRPLLSQTSRSVFLGGKGKISLTAQLHRLHWIAGQRCYLKFSVTNDTKKTVKSLTLALIRTTTVFRPHPQLDALPRCADPDACQTSTTRKQVASSVLAMAHSGEKGHASAKGWWTGVPANQKLDFSHFVLLPPGALSFTRVRLLEVEYTIRVSLSAGSLGADVHVILPIRIINFLSIDPPPSSPLDSPEAISGRYFMRESDSDRNKTSISVVRGRRALMDGGFAGAPYFDYDSETTPRLNDGPSERSISVYDDSSSMDEHLLQRRFDAAPGSDTDKVGRAGNDNYPEFDKDFGNPSTIIGRSPSPHPQEPRQPPASPTRESRAQPVLTPFELRVQEKLREFATSVAKPNLETSHLVPNVIPAPSENGYLKPYGMDKLLKPPNVFWKTSGAAPGFSLAPSHKLPRPPPMTTRPMIKMRLTDPGPTPVLTTHTIDDPSAAILPVFKAQSYGGPVPRSNTSRMRSQTQRMSRPPFPSPAESAFSAVRSRIADMEEKVFELNQRTDGVVPFC